MTTLVIDKHIILGIYKSIKEKFNVDTRVTYGLISIFIPDRDKHGLEISNHTEWVEKFSQLMSKVCGGGCTTHFCVGHWNNGDEIIVENTAIVDSYITDANKFVRNLELLRSAMIDFGKDTNQEVVGFVVDGVFFELFIKKAAIK